MDRLLSKYMDIYYGLTATAQGAAPGWEPRQDLSGWDPTYSRYFSSMLPMTGPVQAEPAGVGPAAARRRPIDWNLQAPYMDLHNAISALGQLNSGDPEVDTQVQSLVRKWNGLMMNVARGSGIDPSSRIAGDVQQLNATIADAEENPYAEGDYTALSQAVGGVLSQLSGGVGSVQYGQEAPQEGVFETTAPELEVTDVVTGQPPSAEQLAAQQASQRQEQEMAQARAKATADQQASARAAAEAQARAQAAAKAEEAARHQAAAGRGDFNVGGPPARTANERRNRMLKLAKTIRIAQHEPTEAQREHHRLGEGALRKIWDEMRERLWDAGTKEEALKLKRQMSAQIYSSWEKAGKGQKSYLTKDQAADLQNILNGMFEEIEFALPSQYEADEEAMQKHLNERGLVGIPEEEARNLPEPEWESDLLLRQMRSKT